MYLGNTPANKTHGAAIDASFACSRPIKKKNGVKDTKFQSASIFFFF